MAGNKKKAERLEVVHPDCAGIGVGKRKQYVVVDPSRFEDPVRHFGTFTRDLEAIADWLCACGVRQVAMESTGVYWIPVFEVLDRAGFEVHLVNPRATKQVSGRKSDVLDCQWIRQLMSYGLLRGAFRTPDALCPMRSYVDYLIRVFQPVASFGLLTDFAADALDARPARSIADIGTAPGPAVVPSEPVAEELHRFLRASQASGLLLVDRQLQSLHEPRHRRQHIRRRGLAEDAEVVRITDNLRTEAPGVAQLPPTQYKTPHVEVAQQR